MSQFMVTPAELRSTAGTLRDYNSQLRNQVGNLSSSEGTLRSQWQGPANDTFHNAFQKDKAFMDSFINEIEKYCQTLETIAAKYEGAEQMNVETASTRKY